MTSPQHILMTADTVGGVWTYAMELARGLISRGIHISLATTGGPLSPAQRREASIRGLDVYESSYKLEWMEDPWQDVERAGEWLLRLHDRLQPDLIHLNDYAHGCLPWNAPSVVVAHSCVYSWWNAVYGCAPPAAEWSEYRQRVRSGLHGTDAVIAVSRFMEQEIRRWYGSPIASCVIYNGRDAHGFAPGSKSDMVLSTGRLWDAAKNIETLDSSAGVIRWPVYVAGSTRHPDGTATRFRNIQSLGALSADELRPWYARSAVYVAPALYEPFGLSVLEAALSGCALVLADTSSLRELWGGAAIYVAPRDDEALGAAINALAWRQERREQLGKRARERALTFTVEHMTDRYLAAYSQAVSRYFAAPVPETPCAS